MTKIVLKRIYEEPSSEDGWRVLVDRLWPHGLSKSKAAIDYWSKEIAPSTELRTWFSHDPAKWADFENRYLQELENNKEIENLFFEIQKREKVTLLYAAKDIEHNNALVLAEFLQKKMLR